MTPPCMILDVSNSLPALLEKLNVIDRFKGAEPSDIQYAVDDLIDNVIHCLSEKENALIRAAGFMLEVHHQSWITCALSVAQAEAIKRDVGQFALCLYTQFEETGAYSERGMLPFYYSGRMGFHTLVLSPWQ